MPGNLLEASSGRSYADSYRLLSPQRRQRTCPVTLPLIQPLDARQPVIVTPAEIRPGDSMRDRGRFRCVRNVETGHSPISRHVNRVIFTDATDGSLSVPEDVQVTVWRTPADAAGGGRV